MRMQRILLKHKLVLCVFILNSFIAQAIVAQENQECEEADGILEEFPVDLILRDVECFEDRIKFDVYSRLKTIIDPAEEDSDIFQQFEDLEQFRLIKLQEIENGDLVQNLLPKVLRAVEQKEQCLMGAQPAHLYERILNKLAEDKKRLETMQTTDIHILRTYLNNLGDVIKRCQDFCKQTKVLISEDEQRQEIKTNFFDSELSNWEIAAVSPDCPTPTPTPVPTPTPTSTPTPMPTPTPTPTPTPIPPPTPNAKAICNHPGGPNQLSIQSGDLLFIGGTQQGEWYWATTMQNGQSGWVATKCVELLVIPTPPITPVDPTSTPAPTPTLTPTAPMLPSTPRFKAKVLADYPGGGDRLRTHAGETLTVQGEEQSGWYWAVNQAGQSGWVLAAYVKLLEPQNVPYTVGDDVLINIQSRGNWCVGEVLAIGSTQLQVRYKLYGKTQETWVDLSLLRPSFHLRDRVLGKLHGMWYKATVIEMNNDSWKLKYDEGFPDAWVGPNDIKAIE